MNTEHELHQIIQNNLENENLEYVTHVGVGGVESDFLIYVPDGRRFTIDIKYWDKFAGFTNQAAIQSKLYNTDIGVDKAFIVIAGLERSNPSTGVVTPKRLIPAILDEIDKKDIDQKKKKPVISTSPEKLFFAAMPFDPKYQDVFFIAMAEAAVKLNAVCKRVDMEEFSGDIVTEIKDLINKSTAVIADLSESNPNVLYEVGYAHGKNIPTVHICSTPLRDLPFDVSHWNTITYQPGQIHKLGGKILARLKAII
jgi:hypothetical protein